MTDEMERQAEAIFAQLDEWGRGSMLEGVLAGIESNWFQSEIAEAAYVYQRELAAGRRFQVGVNRFTEVGDDEGTVPLLSIGAEVEQAQCKRLAELRHHRSAPAVEDSLARVRVVAADPTANVMPAIIDAVRAYCTIGEVMGALADVFGRYVERASL